MSKKAPAAKATPAQQPKRPSLREVTRSSDEARAERTDRQPGSVVNKQIDHESALNPDGTVPSFSYYSLDPVQMKAGRVQKERDRLQEAGYWLADGEEYIPEITTAEIWMTYADITRAAHERRVQKVIDNKNAAKQRLVH